MWSRVYGAVARLGQRVAPEREIQTLTRDFFIGLLTIVIVARLVPQLFAGVDAVLHVYAGNTHHTMDQIIGATFLALASFLLPRAANRGLQAPTAARLFTTPLSQTLSVAGSSIIFRPVLVAALLGAVYMPDMATATGVLIAAATLQSIVTYFYRRHCGRPTSIYAAISHILLVAVMSSAAFNVINWYGHDWAENVYMIRFPLTNADYWDDTLLLLGLMVLGSVVALLSHAGVKWVLMKPVATIPVGFWAFVFVPRRVLMGVWVGVVAWAAAAISEYAVGDEEALIGISLALFTWFTMWFIMWLVSVVLWRRGTSLIINKWDEDSWILLGKSIEGSITAQHRQVLSLHHAVRALALLFGSDYVSGILYDKASLTGKAQKVAIKRVGGGLQTVTSPLLSNEQVSGRDISVVSASGQPIALFSIQQPPLLAMRYSTVAFQRLASVLAVRLSMALIGQRATLSERLEIGFENMFSPEAGTPNAAAFAAAVEGMCHRAATRGKAANVFVSCIRIEDHDETMGFDPNGRAATLLARAIQASPRFADLKTFVAYDREEDSTQIWFAGECGTPVAAREALRELVDDLEATPITLSMTTYMPSLSFGIAFYRTEGWSARDLQEAAVSNLVAKEAPLDAVAYSGHGFHMSQVVGPMPVSDFQSAIDAGDITATVTTVHGTASSGSIADVIRFAWENFPYSGFDTMHNQRLMHFMESEQGVSEVAVPHMLSLAERVLSENGHVAAPMIVVSLPYTTLTLPASQRDDILRRLRALAGPGQQVAIGLSTLPLGHEAKEHMLLLDSMGIGVSVRGDILANSPDAPPHPFAVIALTPDQVQGCLNGDMTVVDICTSMYADKKTLLIAHITDDMATAEELSELGFRGWCNTGFSQQSLVDPEIRLTTVRP